MFVTPWHTSNALIMRNYEQVFGVLQENINSYKNMKTVQTFSLTKYVYVPNFTVIGQTVAYVEWL